MIICEVRVNYNQCFLKNVFTASFYMFIDVTSADVAFTLIKVNSIVTDSPLSQVLVFNQ